MSFLRARLYCSLLYSVLTLSRLPKPTKGNRRKERYIKAEETYKKKFLKKFPKVSNQALEKCWREFSDREKIYEYGEEVKDYKYKDRDDWGSK